MNKWTDRLIIACLAMAFTLMLCVFLITVKLYFA
jgi:hypothetical protein